MQTQTPKSDSGSSTTPPTRSTFSPQPNSKPPLVGTDRAYQPTCQITLRSTGGESIRTALLFGIEVTTTEFSRLKLELTDSANATSTELVQLKSAPPLTTKSSCPSDSLPPEAANLLSGDQGVFWIETNRHIKAPRPPSQYQTLFSPSPCSWNHSSTKHQPAHRWAATASKLIQDFF